MNDTINQATLDRYLDQSNLSDTVKADLRAEFKSTNGSRKVLDKAVSLSGRKVMTKVPSITSK